MSNDRQVPSYVSQARKIDAMSPDELDRAVAQCNAESHWGRLVLERAKQVDLEQMRALITSHSDYMGVN